MHTPGYGFLHHASSVTICPLLSVFQKCVKISLADGPALILFITVFLYLFLNSFTVILARSQVGVEINTWYLPPGALRLPAPIWTDCSVGLQHNCHPGTSLHYSSGLDPIFPGPHIFLFLSLLLCSGLCGCFPTSIPLLSRCITTIQFEWDWLHCQL